MAVTLTQAEGALKSYYLDAITEELDKKMGPFYAAIEKTASDVYGKDVVKVVQVGVNGGIGAGTEDGTLPVAAGNKYAKLVTPLKNLYGTIELSDKAIRASANNAGSVVNLLNAEMEGLVKSAQFNFGRMLYGDGSGKLALVEDVTAGSATFGVDNAINIEVGMIIDIITASGTGSLKGVQVLNVNKGSGAVTINSTATTAALEGATVKLQGGGEEITGLGAIFSNSTSLYGVTRSGNAFMTPNIVPMTTSFTLDTLQSQLDGIEIVSGSKPNLIICSLDVRRILQKLFAEGNVNMSSMILEGGYTAMSYNGIPIYGDRFCPRGTMYILNTEDFELHQLCDWKWLEGEGGEVLKQIPGKPVYTATLVKYAELICTRPCGQSICLVLK